MSFKKEIIVLNNGYGIPFSLYHCDDCYNDIRESDPHYKFPEDTHYCLDCAFKKGLVLEVDYLSLSGIHLDNARAAIRGEEIVICVGKAPWEKSNQDIRSSKEYSRWRTAVFERDGYTCQYCSQVGGTLNAHHIKSFAKYPQLRCELSNGQTLCYECHKEVHKRR